jgi:hypothetical protein
MDETYIMNQVKEACCFVSKNFKEDLEACRFDWLYQSLNVSHGDCIEPMQGRMKLYKNTSCPT